MKSGLFFQWDAQKPHVHKLQKGNFWHLEHLPSIKCNLFGLLVVENIFYGGCLSIGDTQNSWDHHAFTSPKAWNDLVLTFDDSTLLEILLLSSPLSLSLSLWLFRDGLLDAKTWCCVSFNYNFNVWMPPYCPQLGNWCQFTRLHWPSGGSGFQSPTVALNKFWRQESLPPVSTTSLLLLT